MKNSFLSKFKQYVKNREDLDKLFENLYQKTQKDDTSPELWIAIFVLQFANLENYLKRIISSVISQAMSGNSISFDNSENEELTFGQAIDIFEELFVKDRLILKSNNNKLKYEIKFNLRKQDSKKSQAYKVFKKIYLKRYILYLRKLSKFRNGFYHNLFADEKKININNVVEDIKKMIDFEFIPEGTYNDYEFDERYYEKLKTMTGFSRTVELKHKSLISKKGEFPPEKYLSINMALRIMFYHYSFTFMGLRKGINY